MTDITAIEIGKPLNWQDFQRNCVHLFRRDLGDRHVQEWGREGQKQNGIDLHGYRDGDTTKPVGIQCRRIKEPLTEQAMRDDAEAARVIKPALTELIFAATTERDVKAQTAAATLTAELRASGWPCRVVVMSWPDLCQEIVKYDDVLAVFQPSGKVLQQPIIEVVQQEGRAVQARFDQQGIELRDIRDLLVSTQRRVAEDYDRDLEPEAQHEPVGLHKEISQIRRFIQKGRTGAAGDELEALLKREPAIPAYARYRVLSNLAAVNFAANRYDRALAYAREAHALRPNDPKAQTNLAYAELASGDREAAARRAAEVLASHPTNGAAASALLQARMRDKSLADPYALVPAGAHDTVEFKIGAIVFLRQRDDVSWRAMAAEASAAHADNEVLKRFAAEAKLEPILIDPAVMVGKPIDPAARQTAIACAATLRELWSKEIVAEDVNADETIPLACNLASALRFAGDDAAAADVLDRTIAKAGRDTVLVRARAILHLHADEDVTAVALLDGVEADAELQLFAAQVMAGRDPAKALERLSKVDPKILPANLQPVVTEVRAEIAIARGDGAELREAIAALAASDDSSVTIQLLTARGREKGLIASESGQARLPPLVADEEEGDDDGELPDERTLVPHVRELVRFVREKEPTLEFADRVMLGQYLERHGAPETASDVLHGRVATDRNTAGLRTYLMASIAAGLASRSKAVLDALPAEVAAVPFFVRAAATHYWNVGDAAKAAPLIERLHLAEPDRLHWFDWHLQALLRQGDNAQVRTLLIEPVEDRLKGSIGERARLARALTAFGYVERALKLSYRDFATNRGVPAAWMSFMSVMLLAGKSEDMGLLSPVITGDHAFEVRFPDGTDRRYLIEADEAVRRAEPDALPPDHRIAQAVFGKQPADKVNWPDGGTVEVTAAKHKYLDAFHAALARYNERFPAAKGLKQVKVTLEGENAFEEITAEVRARTEYVQSQTASYAEGKMSLAILAFMTGISPIDVMMGLSEVGTPYRVAIGLQQERIDAFSAIAANERRGCVVDAATLHCIRRLGLASAVEAICGKIGITQATADHYSERLQTLDTLGTGNGGTMGYRDGRLHFVERNADETARTRALIEGDIAWLRASVDIVPAVPMHDPPTFMRRLGMIKGARFFDEIYAASGSGRILLVDDLFTRQAAGQLGVSGVWLQPVLMNARDKKLVSVMDYAKAITDLIDAGQTFISVDPQTLMAAHRLDGEVVGVNSGRRIRIAVRSLGGRHADINSHCRVAIVFLRGLWSTSSLELSDYAATSALLRSLQRERTGDYQSILTVLDHHVDRRAFSVYLRQWARGHFLRWPTHDPGPGQ